MSAIEYAVEGGVALLTINRPEARNALNLEVRTGITDAVRSFEHDEAQRALVITGAGDVAFSAGADLKEMAETGLQVPSPGYLPDLSSTKPIIAAVNGVALGGGFYVAQQADLVIAADHATFGITEARFGRGAPWALPLPWLVSPRAALQLMMTAEPIDAMRAYEMGFVNEVVPGAALMTRALELAAKIANLAPLTVRASKAMVKELLARSLDDSRGAVDEIWRTVYLSDDAQEGPRAFAEKRAPRWSGR